MAEHKQIDNVSKHLRRVVMMEHNPEVICVATSSFLSATTDGIFVASVRSQNSCQPVE
jgi:hypothetical protein